MTGDYPIGRGKPPKASRFKSGQSGNPRGRPKGSRNISTIIDEALSGRIHVREGGRRRSMSAREAIIKGMLALRGDPKTRLTLIGFDFQMEAQREGKSVVSAVSSDADAKAIARLHEYIRKNLQKEQNNG